MALKVLIIGGVAGGMSAATRLRRLNEEAEITVIEKSGYVSYANCGLPYFVGGVIESESSLLLQSPQTLHARFRLDVRISTQALEIRAADKTVLIENRLTGITAELGYDKLILSPGASPFVPEIPGVERALTLRTVEDVEEIVAHVGKRPRESVVIGGGYIGVEIAENLILRGIPTSIIEATPQVLAPLDPEMAALVGEELIRNGVDLYLGQSVTSISPTALTLSDGRQLPAELLILAIGVRPEIALAQSAGLTIGKLGGIVVDENSLTSNPDIYAIGDAAEKTDSLSGEAVLIPLANIANRQGRMVADQISGRTLRPVKSIGVSIVKVFDLAVATTGWNEKRLLKSQRAFQVIHTHPSSHAGYYPGSKAMALKLLMDPISGEILGAQGIGVAGVDKRIDVIATAMRGGITAPELADLELAYAPPYGSAKDPVNMLGYIAENLLSHLVKTLQWSEVAEYVKSGFAVLDVRTPAEFLRGSLPGAINISLDQLRERVGEILNKDLIVHCQVGQRGHTAALILTDLGFNAFNLDGGFQTWSHSPAAILQEREE